MAASAMYGRQSATPAESGGCGALRKGTSVASCQALSAGRDRRREPHAARPSPDAPILGERTRLKSSEAGLEHTRRAQLLSRDDHPPRRVSRRHRYRPDALLQPATLPGTAFAQRGGSGRWLVAQGPTGEVEGVPRVGDRPRDREVKTLLTPGHDGPALNRLSP